MKPDIEGCSECGCKASDGWALYCVKCYEQDRTQAVKDIINLLMIQHEAAMGKHNYFLVAANLIQTEFGGKE